MKIKWLNPVLKFVLTVIVLTGCIGLYYFTDVINNTKIIHAQELTHKRILLYEYNNIRKENLGNGKQRLTMEMAVPYKIYIKEDTLINESKFGNVKYLIAGKENYAGRVNNGNWEDIFEINSDSVVYEFNTDLAVEMRTDTVVFKKNGNEVLELSSFKVFDSDNKPINVSNILKSGNKVTYKFNRIDKSKAVKVDPTWEWQPSATPAKDATARHDNPDTNYETFGALYVGYTAIPDSSESFVQFEGWADSIGAGKIIDSAFIYLTHYQLYGAPEIYIARVTEYWAENTLTWNNKPAFSSPKSADTLSAENNGAYSWKFDVTYMYQQYYNGTYADSGQAILDNKHTADNYANYRSSDYATPSVRPKIIIEYSPESLSLDLAALSDSSIKCTIDTSSTGYVDSFIIMRNSDSSAVSDIFYTLTDTLDTLSVNTEYLLTAGGYVNDSLTFYSLPESLYTLAVVADSPFVQGWTAADLRIHPNRGENPSNTEFAIYDSTSQRYINSSGDTVTSAVWQTETGWDSVIVTNRSPNTLYTFGVFAKNGNDSITAISGLSSGKTNSYIDSIEVNANSDSSYIVYFGGDSVYSPFVGYCVIDDEDSSVVSDTLRVFQYGIKSINTNRVFAINSTNRLRVMRIENQADSFYYSEKDSAFTLTAKPTAPVISGISDSTFLLQFDDVSGNPDSIEYAVFDSTYSMFRYTSGDTTSTIVFAVDTLWNNAVMKTYSPNLLISIGVFGKNHDSVYSETVSDTTWVWAAVPGSTLVSIVDSATVLLKINPNGNPDYTYFAVEDSISGKFIDVSTKSLRASGVTVDSIWAFGTFSDWGGSDGVLIKVTPKTSYYFRAYSKDGNNK